MKPKWILVDIGNVLLLKDSGNSFVELLAEELDISLELAALINKEHYTTMETRFVSEEEFTTNLAETIGYEAPRDIFSYFARAYEKQVRPNLELFNYLEEVRTKGIKTAILSNTTALYQQIQARHGINQANGFEPILYSWEVGMRKPNADIFELAVKNLGAEPNEIMFIDDHDEHLEGARGVGLQTIHFNSSEQIIADLAAIIGTIDN